MTTAVIDCDFDSTCNSSTNSDTGTTISVVDNSSGAPNQAAQARFSLASLPAGLTVTDSVIQFNVTAETVEAGETVDVYAYNGTGDDDPEADSGDPSTKRDRSHTGSILVSIEANGGGTKSGDLGATADGQIQGNVDVQDFWAIGMWPNDNFDASEAVTMEAIENAGTDPATLTVVYTEAAAGVVGPLIGGRLVNNSILVGGRLVA